MKLTRRHVLALLACVPASAALGAGGLYWRWWNVAPAPDLAVLSPDEYGFLQAMAEAWMPAGGTPALSGKDADMGRYFDGMIARVDPAQQRLLKLLIQAFDDRPRIPHLAAFQDLDLDTRIAILQGWVSTDHALLRTGATTLLLLMSEGWATHPDVIASMNGSFGCAYGR